MHRRAGRVAAILKRAAASVFLLALWAGVSTGADPAMSRQGGASDRSVWSGTPPRASGQNLVDLERLKRSLAQMPQQPGTAVQVPADTPGRAVTLTLQQSIDISLQNNLGIQTTRLARESARVEITRARAALFHPTVGLALSASRERLRIQGVPPSVLSVQTLQPFVNQTLPTATSLILSGDLSRFETHDPTSSEEFDATVALSVVQPLLRGGRTYVTSRPVRDAEFDFRVADEQLRAEKLRIIGRTKTAYYDVIRAEKVIEATEAAIERDKILIQASESLFRARLVTKRDVFSAELALAQDSARLVSARADLESARYGLLDVLGLSIGTEVQLLDREMTFEPVPIELDHWIAIATVNRPEVLAVEHLLAKNSLAIRVARNAVLPQLDLVGSYGRTQTALSLGRSLELGGDVWTLGLVFSIPLGNVAAKAALTQAELDRARLLRDLSQTKRQIELEVRAVAIKLLRSVERMKVLTVAIEQAKGKLEVGRAQFALGQATNLDITDAQQSLLNAETDLLAAIVDHKVGLAELEAALGHELGF